MKLALVQQFMLCLIVAVLANEGVSDTATLAPKIEKRLPEQLKLDYVEAITDEAIEEAQAKSGNKALQELANDIAEDADGDLVYRYFTHEASLAIQELTYGVFELTDDLEDEA